MRRIVLVLVLLFSCSVAWGEAKRDPIGTAILKSEITFEIVKELQQEIEQLKQIVNNLKVHMEVDHEYESGELIDGKHSKSLEARIAELEIIEEYEADE